MRVGEIAPRLVVQSDAGRAETGEKTPVEEERTMVSAEKLDCELALSVPRVARAWRACGSAVEGS